MLFFSLHLVACAPAADSSATFDEGLGATFGSASGACMVGEGVLIDVGSDVAVVSGDSCSEGGCVPIALRRQKPGSSVWFGSCGGNSEESGWTYSIAWVVPA